MRAQLTFLAAIFLCVLAIALSAPHLGAAAGILMLVFPPTAYLAFLAFRRRWAALRRFLAFLLLATILVLLLRYWGVTDSRVAFLVVFLGGLFVYLVWSYPGSVDS